MRLIILLLVFTFALPATSSCCEPCFELEETSCQTVEIKTSCHDKAEHNNEASEGFSPCGCNCSQRVLQFTSALPEITPILTHYIFPEQILFKESQYLHSVLHPPIS